MSWPSGSDPWYLHNQSDNEVRRNYYGITGIPAFRTDGQVGTLPTNGLATLVANRLDRESPYLIEMDPELQGDGNIHVPLTITLDEALPDQMKLYIALVEEFHHLEPPGPNGVADYYDSMLDMHPNASGTTVTGDAGGTVEMEAIFPYESQYPLSNLAVIAWIQSTSTNEVLQAQYNPVPATTPFLTFVSHTVIDPGDMENGRPDAGETAELTVLLENDPQFLATDGLTGTLTCDNENITITDNQASWDAIEPGAQLANTDDHFVIEVPEEFEEEYVTFTVTLSDGATEYTTQVEFIQLVGTPDMLFVNDYGDGDEDYDAWFNMFMGAGVAPEIYTEAAVTEYGIMDYSTVIWATSTADGDVLTEAEVTILVDFMEAGGNLILNGEQIGEDEGSNQWFQDWFKVYHRLDAPPTASRIRLVPHNDCPDLFLDLDLILVGGDGHSTNPSTLSLVEDGGAVPFFKYIQTTERGASGYRDDDYAAVYVAFNMQAVSGMNGTTAPGDLLNTLLTWMGGDVNDVPSDAEAILPTNLDLSTWPNPFNAALSVDFALPQAGQVKVSVFNLLGQEVARLASGSYNAGHHTLSWDATDMSSGIYLVRVATETSTVMRKVSLIK